MRARRSKILISVHATEAQFVSPEVDFNHFFATYADFTALT